MHSTISTACVGDITACAELQTGREDLRVHLSRIDHTVAATACREAASSLARLTFDVWT